MKILIPIILIFYIFTLIELDKLVSIIKKSNVFLLSIVFFSVPIQYLIFSLRWKALIKSIDKIRVNFLQLHSILYKGLFIGFFVPSGLGIDVYRIIQYNKLYGRYKSTVSITFLEKGIGFLTSCILILVTYPFIGIAFNKDLDNIRSLGILIIGSFFLLMIFLSFKDKINLKWSGVFEKISFFSYNKISLLLKRLSNKSNISYKNSKEIIQEIFFQIFRLKNMMIVFLFSLFLLIIRAAFMNIAFNAVGFELPFVVNLFVVPLINIIALLPISFGGVGVRETSFIFLYGLFGVSPEGALFISILAFTFVVFNISIGGFLLLKNNIRNG